MTEEAKAVQEVAKAVQEVTGASEKLGAFLSRVFNDVIIHGVGMWGDNIKYRRAENLEKLMEKTEKRRHSNGQIDYKAVDLQVGIKLIEEASLVSDDKMQDRWANLLSNATDPSFGGTISRGFVSILAELEPVDALILDEIYNAHRRTPQPPLNEAHIIAADVSRSLRLSSEVVEMSLRNLMRLGLVRPGVLVAQNIGVGEHMLTAYKDTERVGLTLFGKTFHDAVSS